MLIEVPVPQKFSELLPLAVRCGQECMADPRYTVHGQAAWHEPRGGKTRVDLGGAVLAKHVGISPGRYVDPEDTPYYDWLHALDAMRGHEFATAFEIMDVPANDITNALHELCDAIIRAAFNHETKLASWDAYLLCARLLQVMGL